MEDVTKELLGEAEKVSEDVVNEFAENEFAENEVAENEPVNISADPPEKPLELDVIDFQEAITRTVNSYLSKNSPILISTFMRSISMEIDRLAEDHIRALRSNYIDRL